jgi:hypothetical protein
VQNDLYFWRWVLMGEEARAPLSENVTLSGSFIERDVFDIPSALGGLGDEEDEADDPSEEIAELAEETVAGREELVETNNPAADE